MPGEMSSAPRGGGDVGKAPGIVAVEVVAAEIVRNVEVLVAVVIEVFPRRCVAEAAVVGIEPGAKGCVGEAPASVIAQQDVSPAVVGIVVGHRPGEDEMAVGAFSAVVAADVEVEISIEVVVCGGDGVGERCGQQAGRFHRELSAAVILVDEDARFDSGEEVLVAIVVEVHEEGGVGRFKPVNSELR